MTTSTGINRNDQKNEQKSIVKCNIVSTMSFVEDVCYCHKQSRAM